MVKEALVVCSDKSLSAGVTVWDMESGDHLLHIPTCASPPHGLLCLSNHSIVASQVQRHSSFAGGAIFIWPLNKPQSIVRNYCLEAIGPISSTKDGLYLAGGAPSGNAYIWEVSSGRMVKKWSAHQKSISCLAFSRDGSFLISGSDDGEICVWSLIRGSITALSFSLSGLFLISASEDCTACVWDVKTWTVTRRFDHKKGQITNIVTVPQSSLITGGETNQRVSHQVRISLLDKYPQPVGNSKGTVAVLPSYCTLEDNHIKSCFQSASPTSQQILDLEEGWTPAALQMKVETSVENRLCATAMAKHITDMNKQLRSRLLDLMQCRLLLSQELTTSPTSKRKKQKVSTSSPLLPPPAEEQ